MEPTSEMLKKQSGGGMERDDGYYERDVIQKRFSFLEYNPQNSVISVLVSRYGDDIWKEKRKSFLYDMSGIMLIVRKME